MEHDDCQAVAPLNAGEIMRRLLDGEEIPCGKGRSYALIRGHLVYVYDRVRAIPVPVDGFPNVIGMEKPDLFEMLSITKERGVEWIRENLMVWRHRN